MNLLQTVKKETSGNFEFALSTILRCAENPGKYFAKVVYHISHLGFFLYIKMYNSTKVCSLIDSCIASFTTRDIYFLSLQYFFPFVYIDLTMPVEAK